MRFIQTEFKSIILSLFFFFLSGILTSSAQNNGQIQRNKEYTAAAYVWPSCHHDERFGGMLWPEGIKK